MLTAPEIEKALSAYVKTYEAAHFSWKNRNCTHFTSGWVLRCEGWDPLADLAFGMPRSGESAARIVARRGGMMLLVSRALRRPVVQRTLARVGDVVLFARTDFAGTLAVCNGRTAAALSTDGGVAYIPMDDACCAWHVGVPQ